MNVSIVFPGGHAAGEFLLRWVHLVAGVAWIGFLYWFNLVNVDFQKKLEADIKPKVNPHVILPTLFYFRWGAVVTVASGLIYYVLIMLPEDYTAVKLATWLMLVLVFYAMIFALLKPETGINNGGTLAVIIAVLAVAFAGLELMLNGRDGAHAGTLSIGIGGGYGVWMMLNVWGIIWPNQKRILGLVPLAEGMDKVKLGRRAFLASRTNAWLSLAMLFFMGAASHFPIFVVK